MPPSRDGVYLVAYTNFLRADTSSLIIAGEQTIIRPRRQRNRLQMAVPVTASSDELHQRVLGAPSFFKCHRIEILTVTPDLSFPNIPYMGIWKIGALVRCAVNASKTAQRNDS